ncbi:Peptidoglycan-binding protein, CsiV [Pseudomonas pohangensis]|uniref:Peptidoglycan-binding protein, CsiV n=1 Tax=Pseudomonas pohangensis TaxID=364197 RepID=A0A1H2GEV6_9PSED|nr:CsiV family protein [Pseudomonas pohangensis]SDU18266.1 Peptidoglycan-binding protein, CsiV [Pseudomonas pohangensis]
MRLLRTLPLLLALFAPLAMAGPYQVEVLFFRQAGEVIPASQLAPEDWAMGSQPVTAESQRSTALNDAAAKLIPANGYKVLLHQAWAQELGPAPVKVALTAGNQMFGHYPIEGVLTLSENPSIDLEANLWINQIDAEGVLTGSEQLKQSTRLLPGKLTYIDHGSLGLLVRVSPQ